MKAAILVIGDEILSGNVQDTNSSFAARLLFQNNISLAHILTVADTENAIKQGIEYLFERADFIISSGGLGPTRDDVTKTAIVSYFNTELVFDQSIYDDLTARYARQGKPLNDLNRGQAMVPKSAEIMENKVGTAPIFWMEKEDKVLVTLPGVPSEMRYMFENVLLPRVVERFGSEKIGRITLQVIGIPESDLAIKLVEVENQIEGASNENERYKLAYLPAMGTIRLQIIGSGNDSAKIEAKINDFKEQILSKAGKYIYAEGDDGISTYIGRILREKHATISTAESCTGGYLAHLITSVPGSSDYYQGSIISYANEVKTQELGVSESTLNQFGAVSEETCKEMVSGCLKKFNTTYAVVTTGIAGPTGCTEGKPVGLVWIGVGNKDKMVVQSFQFRRNRVENIHLFAVSALDMLRKFVAGIES